MVPSFLIYTQNVETMKTIEHKNIPSGRGQVLIQVQLIHSLPFATTMKKKTNKKKPYPFLNTCCPQGITRSKEPTNGNVDDCTKEVLAEFGKLKKTMSESEEEC